MDTNELINQEEESREAQELELIRSIRLKFKEVEKLVEGMQSKLPIDDKNRVSRN